MDPSYQQPDDAANEAIRQAIGRDRQIVALHTAFRVMSADGRADPLTQLPRLREADPQNGIYAWLELLAILRGQHATASGPADDALIAAIARTLEAPPAKLYQNVERQMITRILAQHGPDWRATLDGLRYAELWPPNYREIIRELSDRMLQHAAAWRAAGRQRDAATAEQSLIRLETDLVADSPTPDMAFLAAEQLPAALDSLAQNGSASGIDTAKARAAAAQAAQFARDYHQAAGDDTSIIPWTGDMTLVPREHRSLMLSITAVLLVAGSWAALFAITIALGLITLATSPPPAPLVGRYGSASAWLGGLLVSAPLLVSILALAAGRPAYPYLYSVPTIPVALLSPVFALVMIGLASRLFFCPSSGKDWRVPTWGIAAAVALVAASLPIGLAIFPLHRESWRPPMSIQVVRKFGVAIEMAAVLVTLGWFVWGQIRRRRAGVKAGTLARVSLSVACRALLVVSLLLVPTLILSSIADARYQEAFLAAMNGPKGAESPAYPIAARVGADWQEKYFGPAHEVVRR